MGKVSPNGHKLLEYFCFTQINAHQTATLEEEDLSNHMCSQGYPFFPFSFIHITAQLAHECNDHGSRDGAYV